MNRETIIDLIAIENILLHTDEIIHNPFNVFPKESLEKALELIEEHVEEIN